MLKSCGFALVSVLALSACAAPDDSEETTAQGDLVGAMQVGAQPGATSAKAIKVSGDERLKTPFTKYQWICGRGNQISNAPTLVAWVEVTNPTSKTASVSLTVEGAGQKPALFLYGAKEDDLSNCRSWSHEKLEGGDVAVIAPGASVWVLLDFGYSRGDYTVKAKTERLFDAASKIAVPASAGGNATIAVAVDGATRSKTPATNLGWNVASQSEIPWTCGTPNGKYFTLPVNTAMVEIVNPTASAASVSLQATGPVAQPKMFAYASLTPSPDLKYYAMPYDARLDCTTFSTTGKFGGGNSIVIEPSSSVFLVIDSSMTTGVYDLSVTTDALVGP